MMMRKINGTFTALILVSAAVFFAGCSKNPEPETAKTGNFNQAAVVNNNVVSANNNVPANNNVSVITPNIPPPTGSNAAMPTVNNDKNDKKSAPPVKLPTPQIGSGGSDFTLFAQARSLLSADEELLNHVIIEIKEGNVTLTGSVSNEAQKTKAGQLVQSVKGIKSVKNNLRVSS